MFDLKSSAKKDLKKYYEMILKRLEAIMELEKQQCKGKEVEAEI